MTVQLTGVATERTPLPLAKERRLDLLLSTMLERLGYVRVPHERLAYKASWGTDAVEHFVYPVVHPKVGIRLVDLEIGFRNRDAERFTTAALARYGWPHIAAALAHDDPAVCTQRYSLALIAGRLSLPMVTRENISDVCADVVADLSELCAGTLKRIGTLPRFWDVLVADEMPFPWSRANAIIRAAHAIHVGTQLNMEEVLRDGDFMRFAVNMTRNVRTGVSPETYLLHVAEDARRAVAGYR